VTRPTGLPVDTSKFQEWLRRRTSVQGPVSITLINGGQSNLTYRVDCAEASYVLRRPPEGTLLPGAHDVAREYRLVDSLFQGPIPLPRPIGLCEDVSVIGAPFAVTSHVGGLTLRTAKDANLLTAAGAGRLAYEFGSTLASLHAIRPERSGSDPQRGNHFISRQLRTWQRQLDRSPGRDLPELKAVAVTLLREAPEQRAVSIVHGDYRLDNTIVDNDGVIKAVIDWELWTLGDPLADLGIALCYWVDPQDSLVPLGSAPTMSSAIGERQEVIDAYSERSKLRLT
jgi:aminoglycoside phosphotransferase (APT) family kinase protein